MSAVPSEAHGDLEVRIGAAVGLAQQGLRVEADAALRRAWEELGAGGDPLSRCLVAHHLADVQDDPQEELVWDLRALEAAEILTVERVGAAGAGISVAGLYPSLHLNLGEDYRKLGNLVEARRHAELGTRASAALGDDPYGRMISAGLARLAERTSAIPR